MKTVKQITFIGRAAMFALLLAGCRAEEQGRILNYQPGEYLGKPDSQLSESQTRSLRQRAMYQAGIQLGGSGGGGSERDVRPPAGIKELRQRGSLQLGVQ